MNRILRGYKVSKPKIFSSVGFMINPIAIIPIYLDCPRVSSSVLTSTCNNTYTWREEHYSGSWRPGLCLQKLSSESLPWYIWICNFCVALLVFRQEFCPLLQSSNVIFHLIWQSDICISNRGEDDISRHFAYLRYPPKSAWKKAIIIFTINGISRNIQRKLYYYL